MSESMPEPDDPSEPDPTRDGVGAKPNELEMEVLDDRPTFLSAEDVMSEPPRECIVEGMARAGDIVVLVAPSGAGKTFVMLSLSAAIADGHDWCGRTVKGGSVVWFSFEGDDLRMRLLALKERGASLSNFYLLRPSDPISPRVRYAGNEEPSIGEQFLVAGLQRRAEELHEQGQPEIVAVIVDTVRASLSGSEDSSENVSAYQRAVRRLLSVVPSAAAFLVHHAGWQDGDVARKRERGSSAFRGSADATLYLEVVDDEFANHRAYLKLTTLKLRDGERPASLRLVRERVPVNCFDAHGEPVYSCLIRGDTRSEAARESEAAMIHREVDLAVLRAMRDEAATNQRELRALVRLKTTTVVQALDRILRGGLALEGKRGQPYAVTAEGLKFLDSAGEEHQ